MVEAGNPLQCSVQGKRGEVVGAGGGESALGARPIGVRTALTMTGSGMGKDSLTIL